MQTPAIQGQSGNLVQNRQSESLRKCLVIGMTGQTLDLRRPLTASERHQIEAERAANLSTLSPSVDPRGRNKAVAMMLAQFPQASASEEMRRLQIEGFMGAISQFPDFAVRQACMDYLTRQNGEGNENYAFAPTAPQLVRLCQIHMKPVQEAVAMQWRLLNANEPEPEPAMSETEREAMKARVESLVRGLKEKIAEESEQDAA